MKLLSAKELAVHLSVHEWTVKRAYRLGLIPGERLGRLLRFDLEAVREAMREQGRAGQEGHGNGSARIGDSRPRKSVQPAPSREEIVVKLAARPALQKAGRAGACAQMRRSTGNSVPKREETGRASR